MNITEIKQEIEKVERLIRALVDSGQVLQALPLIEVREHLKNSLIAQYEAILLQDRRAA